IFNHNANKSILSSFGITAQDANGFWAILESKAPKLLVKEYISQLRVISILPHVRSINDWMPSGKGRDTLFVSLCNHLFAKYITPRFIWSLLFDEEIHLVVRIKDCSWNSIENT